jgi:RNA polymerase sigma factor (sigma-70 family)
LYKAPQVDTEPNSPRDISVPPSLDHDVVELYFEDAIRCGSPDLLTHAQEIDLSQRMETGRMAAAGLATQQPPSQRTQTLQQLVRRGDEARQKLITSNLRLVVRVATWYRRSALPLPDLIQEGNIGLMQAADKYDWRRGTRFSTHAVWWIRQSITRSIANDSRLIRVPVHIHHKLARIVRIKSSHYREFGHEPTSAEIADDTGFPEQQIKDLLVHLHPPKSLDAPIETDDGGTTYLSAISRGPDALSVEELAENQLVIIALSQALESLTPQEQHFLTRRYGLNGKKRLSLRAAGEAFGLTKSQAQVLEANALSKLRDNTYTPKLRCLS